MAFVWVEKGKKDGWKGWRYESIYIWGIWLDKIYFSVVKYGTVDYWVFFWVYDGALFSLEKKKKKLKIGEKEKKLDGDILSL